MKPVVIRTKEDMERAVKENSFLPMFSWKIEGFSIEEMSDPSVWFTSEEGPWEWKGPVIQDLSAAYGKFFHGTAGYIAKKWYPDFANYRRHGLEDFENPYLSAEEKMVLNVLKKNPFIITRDLRHLCGYGGKRSGFDTIVTRLEMKGYVLIANFTYDVSKDGNQYGWGLARLATPEQFYGKWFENALQKHSYEESREKVTRYLQHLLPQAGDRDLKKLIG